MEIQKALPRYKQLENQLGGKWTYNRHGHLWECDDGRIVWAVRSCSCDDGNCGSSPLYYCYGGKKTIKVTFNPQKFGSCKSPQY